jgi:2-phosphosulfolactate phosphatase
MSHQVNVRFLPQLLPVDDLSAATAVVVDILRASTTICTALANGARYVIACQEIDEAQQAKLAGRADLTGGERGGVKIESFDCGNSPADYDAATVLNQRIAFTTTNGTRALQACALAAQTCIGAFANLSAVAHHCLSASRLEIVCAGTNGEISSEDLLFAGALADRVARSTSTEPELNDQARIVISFWRSIFHEHESMQITERKIAEQLGVSRGGRNLRRLRFENDIDFASKLDRFDFVPVWKSETGMILKN